MLPTALLEILMVFCRAMCPLYFFSPRCDRIDLNGIALLVCFMIGQLVWDSEIALFLLSFHHFFCLDCGNLPRFPEPGAFVWKGRVILVSRMFEDRGECRDCILIALGLRIVLRFRDETQWENARPAGPYLVLYMAGRPFPHCDWIA